ncbi:MAG: phenylalanine--tRNA ligase subunit beta [Caldimicrobium sp.]
MKVPLSWLSEFIHLQKSPEEIAEILTNYGHEVEELYDPYKNLGEIITVKVIEVLQPDDLREVILCKVTDGKEIFTVFTTAKDQVKPNYVLALAKPGSFTFSHQKVEEKVIKKYKSQGMFLSPFEAGISEEKDKLLVFEEDAPIGVSIYELLKISEPVLEVAITPNRGDLLSIWGIARELNLICGWELKPFDFPSELLEGIPFVGKIRIEDEEGCFRYAGRLFSGVEVKESPFFLLKRLFLVGLRPINNIVDITNYVLIEVGQPLHAFDWSKIEGKEVIIRKAKPQESLFMLDGIERTLTEEDLVIADKNKALVLAGIMGGEDSGVKEKTTEVFLESAWFNPKYIRFSSQRHKITTESSYRFERKVDPLGVITGMLRATELILKIAHPKEISAIADLYPKPYKAPLIEITSQKIYKVLGFNIEKNFIENILRKLGAIEVEKDYFRVIPYSYRQDLLIPEDLIEEIARLYGYDKIPAALPWAVLSTSPLSEEISLIKNLKNKLKGMGLFEAITYSFINPELLKKLNLSPEDKRLKPLELSNPISSFLSVMRTTLIPGLLECALHNSSREVEDLALFEIGKVFYPSEELAEEKNHLAILLKGHKKLLPWEGFEKEYDIYDLKGFLEEIFTALRVEVDFNPYSAEPFLKRGLSFDLYLFNEKIGYAGEIKNLILEELNLKGKVFVAEFDLSRLLPHTISKEQRIKVKKPSKYPSTFRDVSMILDKNITFKVISDYIKNLHIPYLEKMELIALYEGAPIPEGKKSLTLRFYYRAEDRTLLVEEVNAIQEEVAKNLFTYFKAKPR